MARISNAASLLFAAVVFASAIFSTSASRDPHGETPPQMGSLEQDLTALNKLARPAQRGASLGGAAQTPPTELARGCLKERISSYWSVLTGTEGLNIFGPAYVQYRSVALMAMVLLSFTRQIWSSVRDLKSMTGMLTKEGGEVDFQQRAGDFSSPRSFAAAAAARGDSDFSAALARHAAAAPPGAAPLPPTALRPAALPAVSSPAAVSSPSAQAATHERSRPRLRAPPAMAPEAGRRSHSEPRVDAPTAPAGEVAPAWRRQAAPASRRARSIL